MDLLVIQPTPFCNISCRYCYLPYKNNKAKMGMEVIDSIGRRLLHPPWVNESVVVAWHAGEPLMAGMEFYEDALSRLSSLAEHGLRLRHAIQTNGMLINDEWIGEFSKTVAPVRG
jgi:uncharacterized protein